MDVSHRQQPDEAGEANVLEQFNQARGGSAEALGELFESCRNYLLLIANLAVKKGLQPKVDASDLVQDTFAEAQRIFERFHGNSEAELRRWLMCILENKIGNARKRYFRTAQRNVSQERPFKFSEEGSDREQLKASGQSPSGVLAQKELRDSFEQSLNALAEDYQTVIRLRVEQDLAFAEIGQRMERSEAAAQKLYIRAVLALKSLLAKEHAHKPDSR